MNPLSRFWLARNAREDAQHGVDAKDRRVTEALGLQPSEVERGSLKYRNAVQRVGDTSRLEEARENLARGEDLGAFVGSPHLDTVALVVTWVVEYAGAILLLKALGVAPAHRVLPAFALTLALIALTRVTVAATAAPPSAPAAEPGTDLESEAEPLLRVGNWQALKRYLLPCAYGLLVVAIAIVRVTGSNAEDVPAITRWAEAMIMVAVSVGPAFVAAWLESRRAPKVELARRLRILRRRVQAEEKEVQKAERFLVTVDRQSVDWTQENARRRAAYSRAFELAQASSPAPPDDQGPQHPGPRK